jgi:hypothetical protein
VADGIEVHSLRNAVADAQGVPRAPVWLSGFFRPGVASTTQLRTTVPQSTEQMAWGVAADANAERAEYQARSQGKQKWESEEPTAKEDGEELLDDGSCFQPGFCAPHGVCVKVPPSPRCL